MPRRQQAETIKGYAGCGILCALCAAGFGATDGQSWIAFVFGAAYGALWINH